MEDVGSSPYKFARQTVRPKLDTAVKLHPAQEQTDSFQRKSIRLEEEDFGFADAEGATIPRLNQQLYKLLKGLKQKEVDVIDSEKDISFLMSLQKL